MSQTNLNQRGLLEVLVGDGRTLLSVVAWGLVVCGGFALFQSATGEFLPHDVRYLGMTAGELCAIHQCRVVHFMFHDRVAFGGVLMALGTLYLWLVEFPLRAGQRWAWDAMAVSGVVGFATFFSCISYGYVDLWHVVATAVLLSCFVTGLRLTRRTLFAGPAAPGQPYRGRWQLLITGLAF